MDFPAFKKNVQGSIKAELENSIWRGNFSIKDLANAELDHWHKQTTTSYNICMDDTIKAFFVYLLQNGKAFDDVSLIHKGGFDFNKLNSCENSLNIQKTYSKIYSQVYTQYTDDYDYFIDCYVQSLKQLVHREVIVLKNSGNPPSHIIFNYFCLPIRIYSDRMTFKNQHTFLDMNGKILCPK